LADAGEAFFDTNGDTDATREELEAAADRYHDAWIGYRDYLYRPLSEDEALFAGRMEKAARKAKLADDRRAEALKRLERYPALRDRAIADHGSLEAYANTLAAKDEAELDKSVALYADSYNNAREEHLKEIYDEGRRGAGLFDDVDRLDWLAAGANDGASNAPYADRNSLFARVGRESLRRDFRNALESPSANRIESYDDELAALDAASKALRASGREDLASVYGELRDRVVRTRTMDDRLVHGESGGFISTLPGTARTSGAAGALEDLGGE